jgi:hypothetical protein
LHHIWQVAFGWSDEHLHCFRIHGKEYGIPHGCGMGFDDDATTVHLAQFRFRVRERFVYEYNFYAHWGHEIRVERILPFDPSAIYPGCTGGARAAPPESCGGPWAYLQLLDHHTYHFPYEALEIVATALENFLRSSDEQTLGDRDELQEAYLGLSAATERKLALKTPLGEICQILQHSLFTPTTYANLLSWNNSLFFFMRNATMNAS